MAVIPSFNSYSQKPDLAGAYLGAQRIRQQAAEAAARIQLGREQLAQEAVQAQMELAAKKEVLASEALRRSQEQEIEKAYRQTQIGLKERELANDEAIATMRVQEAGREFGQIQEYQRLLPIYTQEGINRGLDEPQAREEAARRIILERGGTGLSTALERPQERTPRTYSAVAGLPEYGIGEPSRVSMTADEFQTFLPTASPQVRTNPVNVAIQSMLTPPSTNTVTSTNAPSGPRAGDIIKGYRFKGGNPSNRTNWEKVR